MRHIDEQGKTFSKSIIVMAIIGFFTVFGLYLWQVVMHEKYAEAILNAVWEQANLARSKIEARNLSEEEEEEVIYRTMKIERKGWGFSVVEDSTATLVKIETEKRDISAGVCRALKKLLKQNLWQDILVKVSVIDRMGDEKTDILIYDCPDTTIPALRFHVKFAPSSGGEDEIELEDLEISDEEEASKVSQPAPVVPVSSSPVPSTSSSGTRTSVPSYTKPSCPIGTSEKGTGGLAVLGCKCNRAGETWNGKACESSNCPAGSSRYASGSQTNVAGCRCNADTPVWSNGRCTSGCSGNKILISGSCVCPKTLVPKKGATDMCVECNELSDCYAGFKCVANRCVSSAEDTDCSWGICQTCDENKVHRNMTNREPCETGGLVGFCNNNGTCYPKVGRRCSSVRGCPAGQFCNYGGNFNSNKRQRGKFGHTPNVCQVVSAQEFLYQKVTYYYNSKQDLKSWCRAANNKPNCLWGYLAKPGAESWCASLGKRLLTRSEMSDVWKVLRNELPKTYKGYAYWVQEGVWVEDSNGKLGFGTGHPDGYGGRGGVVCR